MKFSRLFFLAVCSVLTLSAAALFAAEDGQRVRPVKEEGAGPRIYLCTDLESVAGVLDSVNWCLEDGRNYEEARHLLMGEINAAVAGFFDGGASEVTVLSGHGAQALIPEELDERATMQRGTYPGTWPWRLDCGYDALAFLGQHAKAGTPYGHLTHTGNMGVIDRRVNGLSIGEYGQLALCAKEFGIPTIFSSGDAAMCDEAEALTPGVVTVAVKFGLNPDDGCREMTMEEYRRAKTSVVTLAPEAARKKIYAGAKEAVERLTKAPESFTYADNIEPPYVLETEYRPAEHGGEIRKERKEHPTSFSALMRM